LLHVELNACDPPAVDLISVALVLQLAQRQRALGHSDPRLRLFMTRRDVASYLGMAHETASRALTALLQGGCISVSHRDLEITDKAGLRDLPRMTRGRSPREGHELAT
jgi:CRP/FNR family transcriptional regulator